MQDHDVLLTMAEIAVAFIGFAGIVVVFQRREADAWERTDTQRFWLMVVSALLALVFSLLPLLFIAAGRSSETTWAVCSAAMAVFVGAGPWLPALLHSADVVPSLTIALRIVSSFRRYHET